MILLFVCVFVGVTGFEVNFMDDVGQTLLNWASAFGTQEMVSHVFHTGVVIQVCHHLLSL